MNCIYFPNTSVWDLGAIDFLFIKIKNLLFGVTHTQVVSLMFRLLPNKASLCKNSHSWQSFTLHSIRELEKGIYQQNPKLFFFEKSISLFSQPPSSKPLLSLSPLTLSLLDSPFPSFRSHLLRSFSILMSKPTS